MPEENDDTRPSGFTQADVDRIVTERLNRERAKFADYDELKAKAEAADKAAEAGKDETQKLTEQLAKMQDSLDEERRQRHIVEVTQAKGLTPAHVKRLSGKTREEIEASADELLADFPLPKADNGAKPDDSEGDDGTGEKPVPPSKPREDIKPGGGDPDAGSEITDPAKLAEGVPRGF